MLYGGREGGLVKIGTLSFMMLVTLNFYITSSPIQMSSQSKFLKYCENLSKSLNQMWKHPSKCTHGCQSRRWGWEVSVTGKLNLFDENHTFHFQCFFKNMTCKASTNMILVIPLPNVLSTFSWPPKPKISLQQKDTTLYLHFKHFQQPQHSKTTSYSHFIEIDVTSVTEPYA